MYGRSENGGAASRAEGSYGHTALTLLGATPNNPEPEQIQAGSCKGSHHVEGVETLTASDNQHFWATFP